MRVPQASRVTRTLPLAGVFPLLLAMGASAVTSAGWAAEISGTLVPRDAAALPPGALVSVSLRATAGPGRLGRTLAETRFAVPATPGAVAFTLSFEPTAIEPGRAYAVAARIVQGGTATWLNTERVSVDPRAASGLTVPLVRAGAPRAPAKAAQRSGATTVAVRPVVPPVAPKQAAGAGPAPAVEPRVAVARAVVAMAAPEPQVVQPAPTPAPTLAFADAPAALALRCVGQEPGWSLLMQGGMARLRTQADPAREMNAAARYSAAPGAEPPFAMLRTELPGAGTAVAVLTNERCADSISGEAAPIRARLSMPDGTPRTGCCTTLRATTDAAPETEDWGHLLPLLLPAVRACAVARPGNVVRAWPMLNGKAGVRIVAPDGTRHDCLADLASRRVERVGVVGPVERMPGEGRPVFRPGIMARAEACRTVQPVRGADGAPVGSMAWETCG